MQLTRDDIFKLARLSRLKLSDEEAESYKVELSAILDYVRQLDTVDTTGISPTYQVTGLTSQDDNATREDEVLPQIPREDLLKNVPKTEAGHIRVKRMIS